MPGPGRSAATRGLLGGSWGNGWWQRAGEVFGCRVGGERDLPWPVVRVELDASVERNSEGPPSAAWKRRAPSGIAASSPLTTGTSATSPVSS